MTGRLATLPGYTVSDYDPAILLRREWYCIFSSARFSDRPLHELRTCTPATPVHYDLDLVRRMLRYDIRSGKAIPFERRHIFRLVLPEGVLWPMSAKRSWRFDQWRKAGGIYPLEFVETVDSTRKQNIRLIERQITQNR